MKTLRFSRFTSRVAWMLGTAFYVLLLLIVASATAQLVEIPDPNLRQAIREELQLPAGVPITQQEMLRLTDLGSPQSQIVDLTRLEHASNLRSLSLWGNSISDLTPLSNLTQLRLIDLAGNDVADISPLANLTQLEVLNLGWNVFIQDITPLSNLTNLYHLRLTKNRIVDIRPLSDLTQLKELFIDVNRIIDFSPIDGLSLTRFEYDESCELPALPIEQRIKNRTFPSVFSAWGGVGGTKVLNRSDLSAIEQLALHDYHWSGSSRHSNLYFAEARAEWKLHGLLEEAKSLREQLLSKNPNMIFIFGIDLRDANADVYPEDFPYWLRDSEGNRIKRSPTSNAFLTDFTQPGMQDIIVEQAVAVAKCGLYDGIFFEWFKDHGAVLTNHEINWSTEGYVGDEVEQQAKDIILQRIRAAVRDDFLIFVNTNRDRIPRRAWGINGLFMETLGDKERGLPTETDDGPYTHTGLIEIETTLSWAEKNLRSPQVNCLEGWGDFDEPPDSPTNKRFMRVFTTMSLTHSDGYVLYIMNRHHEHFWYSFWDANLGQPVGPKTQPYEDVEGLFIREFTNGWAVYNRSGKEQAIALPRVSTGVSSNKQDITHLLPDLDGEIYLKVRNSADVNGDWIVNILDLLQVANGFGKADPDPNADGQVDILDLVFVARQFGQ